MYGASPGERPWQRHTTSKRISEGDLGKLVRRCSRLHRHEAVGARHARRGARCRSGTWRRLPDSPSPAKRRSLLATETAAAVPGLDRRAAVDELPNARQPCAGPGDATPRRRRLAYCQPYVTAIFNFLLRDQPDLGRWQSGVLWTDGSPKASYVAWRGAIAEANAGTVNCALFADPSAQPPTGEGDEPASGSQMPRPRTTTPPPPLEPAASAPHVLTIRWAARVGRDLQPPQRGLAGGRPRQPARSVCRDDRDGEGPEADGGTRHAGRPPPDGDPLRETPPGAWAVPGGRAQRQHRSAQHRVPRALSRV